MCARERVTPSTGVGAQLQLGKKNLAGVFECVVRKRCRENGKDREGERRIYELESMFVKSASGENKRVTSNKPVVLGQTHAPNAGLKG